jgi:uncharacterized membrane protein YgcG
MVIMRILKHLFSAPWQVRRCFSRAALQRIEAAIADSEHTHRGELRFAVESALPWLDLLRGLTARQRAVEVFSRLRVWDTEHNTGVLIYLLLAEHVVEIVADRGIHAKVGEQAWQSVCRQMEMRFRAREFELGVAEGIQAITALLRQHFPADDNDNPNELADAPIIL